MGVLHSFEKMKPQLCFFLKKPSLVNFYTCPMNIRKYIISTEQHVPYSENKYAFYEIT